MAPRGRTPDPSAARGIDAQVRAALREDRARQDRTSRAVIPRDARARGVVTAQAPGVLSGIPWARAVARVAGLTVERAAADGTRVGPGTRVLVVRGRARAILAAERTLLNYLLHASGVATATDRAVRRAGRGPRRLEVWGTRKTLPGLRDLEKAAIVHGGGHPHRRDLATGILIKSNHLVFASVEEAVRRARALAAPGEEVEVEVRTPAAAIRAARAGAHALLLDNASPTAVRAVVRALARHGLRAGRRIEASGGITPDSIARYRRSGATSASLGALTHSAPALPFHLTVERLGSPTA